MAKKQDCDMDREKSSKKHPICTTIPNIKHVMKAHKEEFEKYDDSDRGDELMHILGRPVKYKDVIRYRAFRHYMGKLNNKYYSHGNMICALMRLYTISPEITVRQMVSMIKLLFPDEYHTELAFLGTMDMGPCIPNLDLIVEPY